ncbi:acyl-CoA dehydrogenase family protein [Parafrankia sp. FMc2]|uniref:acyl-CoA dehydrogenase family protein n=1 Tax=Parafrankia sp. FMc2 TaxID=3233196 RepID=UPI0034D60BC8
MTKDDFETIDDFRLRARAWIRANLRPVEPNEISGLAANVIGDGEALAVMAREREIQRILFDAGFAGICFPREYSGQGLTPAHQRAFNEEITGYECPVEIQAPTFAPCAAVLLEFGTEEQKQRHLPAILKGEEIWMQLLSEPSGGSDVASALTSAVRDGDDWIINGSKIWTSGAWLADWALCLARTDWDVPKHRGLTVFLLPLRGEGVQVHRIEMINGNREFCQEFLTDVRVPDSDRIGAIDGGWTVGTRWMFHERMLYNSPYVTVPAGWSQTGVDAALLVDVARDAGRLPDPGARDLIGEGRMLEVVEQALQQRIARGMTIGRMPDQAAAVGRLFHGVAMARTMTIAFDLAGGAGVAWTDDDGAVAGRGIDFLVRQTACIGGGTTEMARNVISERVLGMPREPSLDRDRAFRDIPRGPSPRS